MKLLLVTPQLPYPPHQGTTIRNFNLAVQLGQRHAIHLVSFVDDPTQLDAAKPLHDACRSIYTVPLPHRSTVQRLISLFTSRLPDMALRLPSDQLRHTLRSCLTTINPDVVQIEGIEMAPYGLEIALKPAGKRPLLVFDDHNAEYVLQRRAFETDIRQPLRWIGATYSWIQWHRLTEYERYVCAQFDRVVVCSEADRDAIQAIVPNARLTVIPNGVDTQFYRPDADFNLSSMPANSVLFTGKMDFRPNIDAVAWFVDAVWPSVRRRITDAQFFIVGQKPHPRVQQLARIPGVTVTGYVPDVRPYMAGAGAYVVPLRIGGGTRLKILEAMAMARPVVSTTVGCEGFPFVPDREVLIADTPERFASAVVELLEDRTKGHTLGANARRFVESRYDWRAIVPQFEEVYASSH